MSISKYRVFLRDLEYRLVDEITDYLSLTAIRRFNAVGTWIMELPSQHKLVPLITRRSGIVIKRDNVTIFSGSIATELKTTALTFTLGGFDDSVILEEPARPTPSQANGPYPDDYHVLTGVASTVLREIVNNNLGPLAPVGTRLDKLALGTDPLVGGVVTFRGNFQTLLSAMQEIAITPAAGGLGFEIIQSDSLVNMIELRTYVPQIRNEAKFSTSLNTARDYEDIWEFPEANYWIVFGGDGFGASGRTVIEGGDPVAFDEVGRRITGVHVANGVTDLGELNQKLAELLAGSVSLRRTTIEPFEVASLEFGDDWDFGDIVTVVVNGVETQQVIREVELNFTVDAGVTATPMIGDPNADNDDRLARHVKAVRDRMTNMELNWRVPPDSVDRSMLVPALKPPIGQVIWHLGSAAPTGYLICQGQAVLQSAYADLWAHFQANGLHSIYGFTGTTFTLPDLRNRSPIGSGSTYTLGQLVGSLTAAGPPHTHPGSHSHGTVSHTHTGASHTHPGSHSHDAGTLTVASHTHTVNIDHNHPAFNSGGENTFAATFSTYPGATTNVSHNHSVDVPALGTFNVASGGPSAAGLTGSTGSDSNAPAASFSGQTGAAAPATDPDSNVFAASYSGTISTLHPSAGLNPCIYAGA